MVEQLTEEKYLAERVDDQIKWFGGKSAWNQKCFKRLRLAEITLASAVTVIAAAPLDQLYTRLFSALAGAAVAVIAHAVSLWKFQELWVQYRVTGEALKREKLLYLSGSAPYTDADRFTRLVDRCERLLGGDVEHWVSHTAPKPAKPEEKVAEKTT